jgi:NAD(P)-dependent dehydrogenase (short-subunit alcohol dehydrogenase family)
MSAVNGLLAGKVDLVTGIANERSVAAGCAHAFRDARAELVLTCREKSRSFVMPVANAIKPRLLLPLDVGIDGALETVFDQIQSTFGRLDFVDRDEAQVSAYEACVAHPSSADGWPAQARSRQVKPSQARL